MASSGSSIGRLTTFGSPNRPLATQSDDGLLEITLSPHEPPSLGDLGASFQALDRLYQRRSGPDHRLVLLEIQQGSVVAIVQAVQTFLGTVMPLVGGLNDAVQFGKTLRDTVALFSGGTGLSEDKTSNSDAEEIAEILRPIVKNGGGRLGLRRFKYRDAKRELIAEFNDNEVQQAYDVAQAIASGQSVVPKDLPGMAAQHYFTEETLIFDQASRAPGKEKGRTGDRGVIATFSSRALPVYFRKSVQSVKDQMVLGDDNPMKFLFIVDGMVTMIDGQPASYTITQLHQATPLQD